MLRTSSFFVSFLVAALFMCGVTIASASDVASGAADISTSVAAAEQNDSDALFQLGNSYFTGKGVTQNHEEAAKWFLKAAENGNVDAQYYTGMNYANAQGVERNPELAANWIRKAAEAGHTDAQNAMGLLYVNGSGVEQNYFEAIRLFRLSSDSGNIDARKNLALSLANGIGVVPDYPEAVRLFRSAADAGSADAQYNLGICYLNGTGVEKDSETGIMWLKLAIQNGYVGGEDGLRVALAEYASEQEFAKWAQAKGIAFKGEDRNGRTLVHLAASDNRLDVLEWLRDRGEELNTQDDEGITPVDIAASGISGDMAVWFKEQGIEPRDMRKAMRWVEDMRAAGIDDKEIDNNALALMCEAAGQGDIKMLKTIADTGVDINGAMKDGSTPLHYAVHARNRKAVKWLKKHNANMKAKDIRGFTPFDYARIRQQENVVGWLAEN